ncbi:MAG: hypothetical protein V1732_01915 [Patescibacteria group bacterium]
MERNGNEATVGIECGILGVRTAGKFYPAMGMATHTKPDIDALGPKIISDFLNIETGKLLFKTAANGLIEGKTAQEWMKDGVILVDMGNGQLDHHPAKEFPNECATSLFYKLVPAEKRSEKLDKFVEFVIDRDTRATAQPFDLSQMCKILTANNDSVAVYSYMQAAFSAFMSSSGKPSVALFLEIFEEFSKGKTNISPVLEKYVKNIREGKYSNIPDLLMATCEETRDLVRLIMEEVYQNQLDFEQARKLFANSPKIFWGNNDRALTYIWTDNKQALRAGLNEGFSVIIIQNSSGNTGIYTQINHRINTDDIYHALVEAEGSVRDNRETAQKVWYNHAGAKQILNGSFTAPNPISTALTLEEIADIIVTICKINNGYLPYCKGGSLQCSEKCNFHWMGVSMCVKIRNQQKKTNGETITRNDDYTQISSLKRRPEIKRKKLNNK